MGAPCPGAAMVAERRRMIPPRSPYSLLQEDIWPDRWRMLCACMMLNCTTRKQVERVLPSFFERWPTPCAFKDADNDEVVDVIRSLGFANRRTVNLKKMTIKFVEDDWDDPRDLPGVGAYAAASYEIFCLGKVPADPPSDHALKQYVVWYNKTM